MLEARSVVLVAYLTTLVLDATVVQLMVAVEVLISLAAQSRQEWLLRVFSNNYEVITRTSGVLLIIVGVYDLAENIEQIQLFLSL